MAEAVKVALIRDRSFFEWLEEHVTELARFEITALEELIRRAAEQHLAHIAKSGDPFRVGCLPPRCSGHWVAHKLEVLTEHELRHGEAVAIGLAMDSLLSVELGFLPRGLRSGWSICCVGLDSRSFTPRWSSARPGSWSFSKDWEEFRQHMGGLAHAADAPRLGTEPRSDGRLLPARSSAWWPSLARLGTDA